MEAYEKPTRCGRDAVSDIHVNGRDEKLTTSLQCSSSSTIGYFELPNERNDNRPQELLCTWPLQELICNEFNDFNDDSANVNLSRGCLDPR